MDISYKLAIEEIEKILNDLENSDLDLDELVDKLERSSLLLEMCKKKLKETEEKVNLAIP